MSTAALDAYRGMNYDIAEAIAPTWERRRSDIEESAGSRIAGDGGYDIAGMALCAAAR